MAEAVFYDYVNYMNLDISEELCSYDLEQPPVVNWYSVDVHLKGLVCLN